MRIVMLPAIRRISSVVAVSPSFVTTIISSGSVVVVPGRGFNVGLDVHVGWSKGGALSAVGLSPPLFNYINMLRRE